MYRVTISSKSFLQPTITLDKCNSLYDACNKAMMRRHIIPTDRGIIKIEDCGSCVITVEPNDTNIGDVLERACDRLNVMLGDDLV